MLEAVQTFQAPGTIDTSAEEEQRGVYIDEAEAVGSVPPPASLVGVAKTALDTLVNDIDPALFLDKLGERIAFERSGTRLYDALITKYKVVSLMRQDVLPPVSTMAGLRWEQVDETPLQTLQRIRAEELSHFRLLCSAVEKMGGDPTAQTPCADVTATASMGFIQVLTDPRTTLAQCLNAMVAAELIDNAGWELLATIAGGAGQPDLQQQFLSAMNQEQ